MSSFTPLAIGFFSFFLLITFLPLTSLAAVPASNTFKFINEGEFGEYIVEYDANYRVTDLQTFPFALCFYNTTPNAFTLGLRMGNRHSESIMRWVWDANRSNPVKENATLTFGTDGNLILADADGSVAWQTSTANKGVVGLRLFSSGNLVLYDKKGRFVWQSFDHPTDTLLVGQSLRSGGPNKLVSRLSYVDGSEGAFSLVLEKKRWAMYMKSKNSAKPLLYYNGGEEGAVLTRLLFNCAPDTDEGYAFDLTLDKELNNVSSGSSVLARPKYNATLSMLRVGYDGNLKIYTYNDKVDWGAWEITYTLFDREGRESECKLPTRCGSLGVCEDDQCVACPTQKGMLGWSKSSCASPVLPTCNKGRSTGSTKVIDYYKVVGVEHFMNGYTEGAGPMKVGECRDKCNKDCGCLGFFYREESSKCLLAPELGTLAKVSNNTHVAFIKYSK